MAQVKMFEGKRAAVAASVAMALFAAACSSGGSSSTDTTTKPTPLPTAKIAVQAKDAASAALVPADVASSGELTYAMDASYPPDEFLAPGSSTIVGMDADLAKALAETLGLKAVTKNVTFDAIIPGLQAKKYDVGLSSFTITAAREEVVDFVSYFSAGEAFYMKSGMKMGSMPTDASQLCGYKVSVEAGTVEEEESKAASKDCVKAGKKAVTVLSFSDQNGANLAVSSGRADLGYADSPVVGYVVGQSGGAFEQVGKAFNSAPYGIAVTKGSDLAKAIESALKVLIANGTYGDIMKKWGTEDGAVTAADVSINPAAS